MTPAVLIGCGAEIQTEQEGNVVRIENLSIGDYVLDLLTERVVTILDMTVRTLAPRQIAQDPEFAIRLGQNADGSAFLIGVPVGDETLMAGPCARISPQALAEWARHGPVFYQLVCARTVLCNLGTGSTVRLARADHHHKGGFATAHQHRCGWLDDHGISTAVTGQRFPGARA